MRLLKTLHGWLGIIVQPWVLIIGLTGLFLNHESLVMGLLDQGGYDEAQFDLWPDLRPMTPETARELAGSLFPDKAVKAAPETRYHGRSVAIFEAGDAQVIVALDTGHYWIKTDNRRTTFAPDGTVLETKIYWESLFKRLHVRGWSSSRFGTWLSDITALAMVFFGLTGMVLFVVPRLRKVRNRRRMHRPG